MRFDTNTTIEDIEKYLHKCKQKQLSK